MDVPSDEVGVEEPTVEDGHAEDPTNKLKVCTSAKEMAFISSSRTKSKSTLPQKKGGKRSGGSRGKETHS